MSSNNGVLSHNMKANLFISIATQPVMVVLSSIFLCYSINKNTWDQVSKHHQSYDHHNILLLLFFVYFSLLFVSIFSSILFSDRILHLNKINDGSCIEYKWNCTCNRSMSTNESTWNRFTISGKIILIGIYLARHVVFSYILDSNFDEYANKSSYVRKYWTN